MVHFPGFARARLWIHRAVRGFCPRGFPHSEIPGSKPVCGSPRLIAAYHVLHRLLLPRHPPCALSSLTTKFTRHTAASPQLSAIQPSAISKTSTRRENFCGPSSRSTEVDLQAAGFSAPKLSLRNLKPSNFETCFFSAGSLSGTHKNLRRLVICPIYSVVKYRPRENSCQPSAFSHQLKTFD